MQFPRLFTDPLNQDKAFQVLHRICDQAYATPSLVYAVLYYADREHLAQNAHTIYGETYLAYHHAAVPSWANHVYMTLSVPSRDVGLYLQLRRLFLINGEGWLVNRDMSTRGERGLSPSERDCIDGAVYWYRSASAREITISRRDASWQKTPQGQPIPQEELQRHDRPSLTIASGTLPSAKEMAYMDSQIVVPSLSAPEIKRGSALA
jgi:hypothetical protein